MAAVEKISIALSKDMASVIRQVVDSGEYTSNSEVIRDALRDWKFKRTMREQQIEELRQLSHQGIKSGAGRFEGIDDILQEAKRQLDNERQG